MQTITLGMFMPNDKILEFGFGYKHKRVYADGKFTQQLFPRYDCSRSTGCEVVTKESDIVSNAELQGQGQQPQPSPQPQEEKPRGRGRGKNKESQG